MTQEKSALKHRTDPERKRATYGLHYPLEELIFENKYDFRDKINFENNTDAKRTVSDKRLTFKVRIGSLESVIFNRCNFHDRKGKSLAEIKEISFKECVFQKCIMGTTFYFRVRFVDCSFRHCDFMNSEFKECIFERCDFHQCTAENTIFTRTEIDPAIFKKSIECPLYNFDAASPEEKNALEREWLEILLRLSQQLYRSNTEIFHTSYSDTGLYEMKKAEFQYSNDIWRYGTTQYEAKKERFIDALIYRFGGKVNCELKRINLFLTKGGTSLKRLIYTALILIAIYTFLLSVSEVSYHSSKLEINTGSSIWISVLEVIEIIAVAISLFLGFGFTAFESNNWLGTAGLVIASMIGVVWYAMIIPVIIRKVYR